MLTMSACFLTISNSGDVQDLNDYTLETVKIFYDDESTAGFVFWL